MMGVRKDLCVVTIGDGLCLPVTGEGKGSEELFKETMSDPSHATWRDLATTNLLNTIHTTPIP